MTLLSTAVRSTHLVGNAAWFGETLMGAVGLNPAARQPDTERERVAVAGTGWEKWAPVQGVAIGLHLVSGLAIVADNKSRVVAHPPTTAAAWLYGDRLGRASGEDGHPRDPEAAEDSRRKLAWLQWATAEPSGPRLRTPTPSSARWSRPGRRLRGSTTGW